MLPLALALALALAPAADCRVVSHVPPAARLAFLMSLPLTGAGAAPGGGGGGGGGGATSQFFFPDGQDLILALAAFN